MILYTPCTGFVDLEAKIAYGLARLGIEATGEAQIVPRQGFFEVHVPCDTDEPLRRALYTLASRMLAAEHVFFLPGIQPRYRKQFPAADGHGVKPVYQEAQLAQLYHPAAMTGKVAFRSMMCGHEQVEPYGGKTGLILATSPHAGMPTKRDSVHSGTNLKLCTVCGALAVLALHSVCFQLALGPRTERRTAVLTPLPLDEVDGHLLLALHAAQGSASGTWLSGHLPATSIPLAFLARFPHVADLMAEAEFALHCVIFDPSARDRICGTQYAGARPFARFISASSFNVACMQRLLGTNPKIETLVQAERMLTSAALHARRGHASSFARAYAKEVQTPDKKPILLYARTAEHILEEVCMIPKEIVHNPSVRSVASTIRYFVRNGNYGYVDSIRNARKETHRLEETLAAMLREAQTRSRAESEAMVWIPTEDEVSEVISLANEQFDEVKLALALLGLSRFAGRAEPEAEAAPEEILEEEIASEEEGE